MRLPEIIDENKRREEKEEEQVGTAGTLAKTLDQHAPKHTHGHAQQDRIIEELQGFGSCWFLSTTPNKPAKAWLSLVVGLSSGWLRRPEETLHT
jgi:hypothetical protein